MGKIARESTDNPQHFQISQEAITSMKLMLETITEEVTKEAIRKLVGNERRVTTRRIADALAEVFSLAKIHGSVLSLNFWTHLPPRSISNNGHLQTSSLTPRGFSNDVSKETDLESD